MNKNYGKVNAESVDMFNSMESSFVCSLNSEFRSLPNDVCISIWPFNIS